MTECWHGNPSARLTALRVKKTMCRLDADLSGHTVTSAVAAVAALKGKYSFLSIIFLRSEASL